MRPLFRSIRRFLSELRRRNVYQVAVTYVVVGFFVIEAADLTLTRLGLPPWTVTLVVVLVGLGFPIALVMAWALEVTPEGVRVEETVAEETEGSEEVPAPASTTRDLWIGGSVLALLLLGAWWLFPVFPDGTPKGTTKESSTETAAPVDTTRGASRDRPFVAVLPLENLSSQKENQFFAELRRRKVYRVALAYLAAGFVVVELADIAAGAFRLPGWFGPLVWTLAGLGFPLALVIAWAFDVTPEGIRRTPSADEHSDAGVAEDDALENPRAGDRSVAVLPFRSLGQDETSALGEGMHDALLTHLSKVSGLKVISRTSVQQYRGTEKTTAEIARELGVKWVVEGGVQELRDQIQVNAQLIDPRTDTHRWAESYRRDLTARDLFDLQSDLTESIARSLKAELTPEEEDRIERQPTGSLDAYRLYVRGRQQLARRSFNVEPAATVRAAAESFQQATDQDAEFALAWAGLADAAAVHQRMVTWAQLAPDSDVAKQLGVTDGSVSDFPDPEESARRALKLDPDLAEAHASMGFVHLQHMDGPAASQTLHRAIEAQPSYWEAHHWLGELYLKIGRPQRALDHVSLAVELNPQHAMARHWLYDSYLAAGHPEKSLEEARCQQEMGLEETTAVMGEVRALVNLGRLDDAQTLAEEEVSELGIESVWARWLVAYLAQILTAQNETDRARECLQQLRAAEAHPSMIAWAHAGLGEAEEAVATYRAMDREAWGVIGTISALRYPAVYGLSALSDAPGYPELIRELNEAWGLNPDGRLPDERDQATSTRSDA